MEEILHQLKVVDPNIHNVLCIPGGAGFLPSTVAPKNRASQKEIHLPI